MPLETPKAENYQSNRELARKIVGDENYMRHQIVLMKEWLNKNEEKKGEHWIEDGWSEIYVDAIISPDFKENNRLNGRIENLNFEDLETFKLTGKFED